MGQEDPLEEEMATHSSILAWRIHGQKSVAGYSPWGCKESDMTEQARTRSSFFHQAHIPCVLIPESKADFPPKRHQIPTCLPGLLCPWHLSRQEKWSGLPFPTPGDLPDPGIEPRSPALAGRFFTTEPPGKQ